MDHRSRVQVAYDRQVLGIGFAVPDMDLIDADGFDVSSLNAGKLFLQKPFLQVFDRMPTEVEITGECPKTHVRPQFEDRPFQCPADAGFGVRQKRDVFQLARLAVRTVKAVNGEFQTDLPTTAEWFTSNAAAAERHRNDIGGTAARTPVLSAAQTERRTFSRIFFTFLLKSANSLCIVKIDRHCVPPIVSFGQ